jgi:hypothetical protein
MRIYWLTLGLVTLLAGCATAWQPGPGQTAADLAQAQYVCAQETRPAPPLPTAAYKTNVVHFGRYQPGALTAGGAALGEGLRARRLYRLCMEAAGAVED